MIPPLSIYMAAFIPEAFSRSEMLFLKKAVTSELLASNN